MSCPTETPAYDLPPIVGPLHEALAVALQHPELLDLTRTLPGRLVWSPVRPRTCAKCGVHISAGHISFESYAAGVFCGPCWDPKRYPRALDVDAALANGDSR